MKKTLLFSGILLALSASMALAGGVNFAWGPSCWADNPVANKTNLCTTNFTQVQVMTGSYVLANAMNDFVGIQAVVDLQATAATLPAWWEFQTGGCRGGAMTSSSDFTLVTVTNCTDIFAGGASGGITAYQTATTSPAGPYGANAARVKVAWAVPADAPIPASPATEYLGFQLKFAGSKTIGTGSCAGCLTPVSLVLNEVDAAGNQGSFERSTGAVANQCLTWQGGGGLCGATPVHNSTWGQVKSLYR